MIPTPFDFYAMEQEGIITQTRSGLINKIKIEIGNYRYTFGKITPIAVEHFLKKYNLKVNDLNKNELKEIEAAAGIHLN